MIGHVWSRFQLAIAQGVVSLIGANKIQARVLDGEPLDNIDRVEPYGFSYRPKPGSRAYLFFPSGDRSYGVALVIGDKRYQMDLLEGEVALHDDQGNFVKLGQGGVATVKASAQVIADTPLFKTTGDAEVGGKLTVHNGMAVTGPSTVNGKNVSDSHTHTTTTAGQPTSGVN